MYSLPDEQNKLLKQLGEIDAQERSGLIPVRSNITLFLIFFLWTVAVLTLVLNIAGLRSDGFYMVIGIVLAISIFLALSYYNIKIGYYLTCLALLGVAGYATKVSNLQNTTLLILIDSVIIFTFANLFGRNGYIIGGIIFATKAIVIYLFFQSDKTVETLVSQVFNMLAIGIIPVLMLSISKVSRRAKKQEIRAEILALQNQDLVSSWGSMFDNTGAVMQNMPPQQPPQPTQPVEVVQPQPATPPPPPVTLQTPPQEYTPTPTNMQTNLS